MGNPVVNFGPAAARELVKAARQVLGSPVDQTGETRRVPPTAERFFWRVTGNTPLDFTGVTGYKLYAYTFTEQLAGTTGSGATKQNTFANNTSSISRSGLASAFNTVEWGLSQPPVPTPVPIGTVVLMRLDLTQDVSGALLAVYSFSCTVVPTAMVPCIVADDGSGANGDSSTAATYKYNVKDLNGNTIGSSLPPKKPRSKGYVTQQSGAYAYGVGFWSGGGSPAFILWDAGEAFDIGSCPASDSDD